MSRRYTWIPRRYCGGPSPALGLKIHSLDCRVLYTAALMGTEPSAMERGREVAQGGQVQVPESSAAGDEALQSPAMS